jgi:hypothetical protein
MKKRYYSLLHFVVLVLIVSACASTRSSGADDSKKKTAAASSDQPGTEDLSKYRPKFALAEPGMANPAGKGLATGIVPTNHVNDRVDALIDTLAQRNKTVRYAKGYRILAYSGTERKAWLDIRQAIVKRVPDERDYPLFTQPNYRLKIGDYFTRVEAQQVLLRIKDISPNAMIITDQINVK